MPSEAITPTSAAASRRPAANTSRPAATSSPARRTFRPASTSLAMRTDPSLSAARSWMTTVSAPLGTIAPVKIRTASPGPSVPPYGRPAQAVPSSASAASPLAGMLSRDSA